MRRDRDPAITQELERLAMADREPDLEQPLKEIKQRKENAERG